MLKQHGQDAAAAAPYAKPAPNGYPANPERAEASARPLREVCHELRERIDAFLAEEPETDILRDVQAQLRISMRVAEEALGKYPAEQISISYNGGKDSQLPRPASFATVIPASNPPLARKVKLIRFQGLVLLIVILASLARRFPSNSDETSKTNTTNGSADPAPFPEKFDAVYVVSRDPFPEVDTFITSSSKEYHLDVASYKLSMRKGLEAYLEDRPSVRAIFVGTRRTDPDGENLNHFDPTDAGWPSFMRVHPVIDWHYAEIWAFIRHLGIEYCPLYDQVSLAAVFVDESWTNTNSEKGYTSLGGKRDTHPNPHLKKQGENGQEFRPAYELIGDDEERLGRDW
ncbi:hypothetical protein G7046_g4084 [Stylonectria norvegica]|nr:hypothetical protein G7046_g4084 [Stylonectria norvegica]